jgi:co-chaperonin GroES (HSP10)
MNKIWTIILTIIFTVIVILILINYFIKSKVVLLKDTIHVKELSKEKFKDILYYESNNLFIGEVIEVSKKQSLYLKKGDIILYENPFILLKKINIKYHLISELESAIMILDFGEKKARMNFRPLHDNVQIRVLDEKIVGQYSGQGIVEAIGKEKIGGSIKVGDKVVFNQLQGYAVTIQGKKYSIISESDILKIVK